MRLVRELGLLDAPRRRGRRRQPAADDGCCELVHDAGLRGRRPRGSARRRAPAPAHGLGTADDPVFAGHARGASAAWSAAAVRRRPARSGRARRARGELRRRPAPRDAGAGQRVLRLQRRRRSRSARCWTPAPARVAYVDVDVHHGDGVERIFWDDPRVLTISLHETGRVLFPGTGFPDDVGGGRRRGTAVNVALPPGTGDAGWLRAFHAVVPPLLRAFEPDVLVTQHGCDTHALDPLAHLALSRRRPARLVRGAARPRARVRGRSLGRARRRRVRGRRRRAAGVDAPRRASPSTAPSTRSRRCPTAGAVRGGAVGRPGPAGYRRRATRSYARGRAGTTRRTPSTGRHGHPPRGLPAARPRPLVRLTTRRLAPVTRRSGRVTVSRCMIRTQAARRPTGSHASGKGFHSRHMQPLGWRSARRSHRGGDRLRGER